MVRRFPGDYGPVGHYNESVIYLSPRRIRNVKQTEMLTFQEGFDKGGVPGVVDGCEAVLRHRQGKQACAGSR